MSSSAGVWVPILAAIVTAFATVITVFLNGRANLKLEREKFTFNSDLERQRFESSLVLHAIATGDRDVAQKNLQWLVKAGFLSDAEGHIEALAEEPDATPVLPAPSAPQPGARPPEYRWPVRTGADADARHVNEVPVRTTVENLIHEERPDDMLPVTEMFPAYQNRRSEGAERTIYEVEATITGSKLMMSQNYHLNLRGDAGATMIASCPHPDPRFVPAKSRWAKEIALVRSQIEHRLKPDKMRKLVNERVRIRGIGFFNSVHGQVGVAPNGLELSPVLQIEWQSSREAPAADAGVKARKKPART